MSSRSPGQLRAELDRIWHAHLPDTRRRATVIAAAAQALAAGTLDDQARERARECAHQMVGLSGTFDRLELVKLARRAEQILCSPEDRPQAAIELGRVAQELQRAIED